MPRSGSQASVHLAAHASHSQNRSTCRTAFRRGRAVSPVARFDACLVRLSVSTRNSFPSLSFRNRFVQCGFAHRLSMRRIGPREVRFFYSNRSNRSQFGCQMNDHRFCRIFGTWTIVQQVTGMSSADWSAPGAEQTSRSAKLPNVW